MTAHLGTQVEKVCNWKGIYNIYLILNDSIFSYEKFEYFE